MKFTGLDTADAIFLLSVAMVALYFHQRHINRKQHGEIMSQIDDLNAAIASIQGDVNNLQTDVQTAIQDIQAGISGTTVDLTGPINKLLAVHDALGSMATNLAAVEVPATTAPSEPAEQNG